MADLDSRLTAFEKENFVHWNEAGDVGGIWGKRWTDVPGWEGGTAGIYGDLKLRAHQHGIKNLEPASWGIREPIRLGHFMWKIIKMPAFFHRNIIDAFRFVFESMVKEVSGVPENSLGTITQSFGAVGQEADYPGIYKESGKNVTIKTCEFRSSLARKIVDYWIGGISDRETGIGTLYGKDIPYVRSAYSASFIYVILGIQGRPEDIEFSCIFHECWPLKEVVGHFGTVTLGDAGSVSDVDIEMSGIYQRGPEVDILAQFMVAAYGIYSESANDQTLPSWTYNLFFNWGMTPEGKQQMEKALSVNHHKGIQMYIDDTNDESQVSWTNELVSKRDYVQQIIGEQAKISSVYGVDKAMERALTPWVQRKSNF